MREHDVTQAMPQNSWPTVAMITMSLFQPGDSAVEKTASDEPKPFTTPARIENATSRISPQMIGQPQEMAIGPPLFHACP